MTIFKKHFILSLLIMLTAVFSYTKAQANPVARIIVIYGTAETATTAVAIISVGTLIANKQSLDEYLSAQGILPDRVQDVFVSVYGEDSSQKIEQKFINLSFALTVVNSFRELHVLKRSISIRDQTLLSDNNDTSTLTEEEHIEVAQKIEDRIDVIEKELGIEVEQQAGESTSDWDARVQGERARAYNNAHQGYETLEDLYRQRAQLEGSD